MVIIKLWLISTWKKKTINKLSISINQSTINVPNWYHWLTSVLLCSFTVAYQAWMGIQLLMSQHVTSEFISWRLICVHFQMITYKVDYWTKHSVRLIYFISLVNVAFKQNQVNSRQQNRGNKKKKKKKQEQTKYTYVVPVYNVPK